MKDAVLSILGEYTPNLDAQGLAQVDWPWLCGAVLLIVAVYCVFRFIGGVFSAK